MSPILVTWFILIVAAEEDENLWFSAASQDNFDSCREEYHDLTNGNEKAEFGDIFSKDLEPELPFHFSLKNEEKTKIKLWPDGIVPLKLHGSLTSIEKKKIKCAVVFFHERTCIRFHKYKPKHKNYVLLVKDSSKGCSSTHVGMAGGEQVVNLEQLEYHCWKIGTIIHELMHVVGFFHEHSRADRDEYVNVHWNNIETRNHKQFKKASESGYEEFLVGTYDYHSVMHYGRFAGSLGSLEAMSAKVEPIEENNVAMGNRDSPTVSDTYKINILYNCSGNFTEPQIHNTLHSSGLSTILIIGGNHINGGEQTTDIEAYFGHKRRQRACIAKLENARESFAYGVINGRIYVAGGKDHTRRSVWNPVILQSTEVYYFGKRWLSRANMLKPRNSPTSTVLNQKMYVCGGSSKGKFEKSCEYFDGISNEWKEFSSLNTPRSGAASTHLNGLIYVIGGSGSKGALNSVEEYDPDFDSWLFVTPMKHERWGLSAVAYDNHIIACGGYSPGGKGHLNVCEKYDPKMDIWTELEGMLERRMHFGLVVFDGRLYAIGGYTFDTKRWHTTLDSVEWYNETQNEWIVGRPLRHPRSSFGVVAT